MVASVNAVFLSDWYSETDEILTDEIDLFDVKSGPGELDCQIIPSGPGFEFENNLRLFLGLIYYAQRKIIIVSPYFVPDEGLLNAITTACHRGLHVELFVSEEGDQAIVYHAQRSYYEVLLRAGVKIWMYRKPYILHSKSMTIDDGFAIIGSSNMDMRSFGLNMEISMLVRGEQFVARDARCRSELPCAQPRAHPRGVGEAAAAFHGARQPRAAHLGAAIAADAAARAASICGRAGRSTVRDAPASPCPAPHGGSRKSRPGGDRAPHPRHPSRRHRAPRCRRRPSQR